MASNEEMLLFVMYIYLLIDSENRTLNPEQKLIFEALANKILNNKKMEDNFLEECDKGLNDILSENTNTEIFGDYNDLPGFLLNFLSIVNNEEYDMFTGTDSGLLKQIAWTVISFPYFFSYKPSENQKKIVSLFLENYRFKKSVIAEMQDTIKTISVVQKQKEFTENNRNLSYRESRPMIVELEKNEQELLERINDLILQN